MRTCNRQFRSNITTTDVPNLAKTDESTNPLLKPFLKWVSFAVVSMALFSATAFADESPRHVSSEASLVLPDLNSVKFLGGFVGGRDLLWSGLLVSAAGIVLGLVASSQIKRLPVHASMLEVSELIYLTCKTYLFTQGK